jgi:cysteinyl-tRNA synthetase
LEEQLETTRELEAQEEKRNRSDFALWKNASPEHIMRWKSPWGVGFPGWHIECSAMSSKYLGDRFDIHGGGMDLQFPHHECEIAQSTVCHGHIPARYWLHNNMITINGRKMGKSYNNVIKLSELFSGGHPLLEQAYGPMTVKVAGDTDCAAGSSLILLNAKDYFVYGTDGQLAAQAGGYGVIAMGAAAFSTTGNSTVKAFVRAV